MKNKDKCVDNACEKKVSFFSKHKKKFILVGAVLSYTALYSIDASAADDPFQTFFTTVDTWAKGAYGKGIAITSVLVGGGIAAAKNSPLPAIAGIALAAILHWGPGVITAIFNSTGAAAAAAGA